MTNSAKGLACTPEAVVKRMREPASPVDWRNSPMPALVPWTQRSAGAVWRQACRVRPVEIEGDVGLAQ